MNQAIILINSDESGVLCTSNGVSPIVMLNAIRNLENFFMAQVFQQAKEIVGDDEEAIRDYMKAAFSQRKQDRENNIHFNPTQN